VNVYNFNQYLEPQDLTELYSVTAKLGSRARIIAGGTDLLVRLKQRTCEPKALINLKKVKELNTISSTDDGIYIGSAVKLSELISLPEVGENYPLLVEAAAKVGAYRHRAMGTIGGNLCLETRCMYFNQSEFLRESLSPCLKAGGKTCHAVPGQKCYAVYSGDTAPALLALGARVRIGSAAGERWEELASLYSGDGLAPIALKEGEVLTGISISKEAANSSGAYIKLAERISTDFPSLGVAASITLSENKVCQKASLALTAAGSSPFLVKGAENLAGAEQLSDALLEPIVDEANKLAVIVKNKTFTAGYRRAMIKKMVPAALAVAWEKALGIKGGCCGHA